MKIIGIIPARMKSSRFPGKPLAKICGIPMVGHVYFRSKMSDLLNDVYIATCDNEIKEYIDSISGKTIITSDKHERASDRVAEAVLTIEEDLGKRLDIIVMIQGDEPLIYPNMISQSIDPLVNDKNIVVSNLMATMKSSEEHEDPNEVKVVVDKDNFALYFSREPIPSNKKEPSYMYKQVCIISFTRDFLLKFTILEPTPLEMIESIDMLRVLEHGYKIKMMLTNIDTYSVDNEEDLKRVEKLMQKDGLFHTYKRLNRLAMYDCFTNKFN